MIERYSKNPIITIKDIKPSQDDMKVIGVFNAGATTYQNEIILILRVAEVYVSSNDDTLVVPIVNDQGQFEKVCINKNDKTLDFTDKRIVKDGSHVKNLTSISHFRLARSKNGIDFTIDEKPSIMPKGIYETWGIEDPRITKLDHLYYITYAAISPLGVCPSIITTKDFKTYDHQGVILPPENKDVVLFSEKINGKFYMIHRPVPSAVGMPNMWISSSKDLKDFGSHQVLLTVDENISWQKGRLGAGAPPVKTDKGWLHIYHAADQSDHYVLSAFLTDLNEPGKIIGILKDIILSPDETYEKEGFYPNVVFTCGLVEQNDQYLVYYGAADDKIALGYINKTSLLNQFELETSQ
jgi:predicted GH43/DUF377 family glycosyl hydrolase